MNENFSHRSERNMDVGPMDFTNYRCDVDRFKRMSTSQHEDLSRDGSWPSMVVVPPEWFDFASLLAHSSGGVTCFVKSFLMDILRQSSWKICNVKHPNMLATSSSEGP